MADYKTLFGRNDNNAHKKILKAVFFAIFTVFFGVLFLTGEPVYVGDTFQYENQMIMREPVYALLMQVCRLITPRYQYWLIILFQNMLAIAANTIFIDFMIERFHLSIWLSLLFAGILLVPHVMTPFFASSHLVLTNALMTEGVLFSLYPLAFMSLLDMMWSGKPVGKKSFGTLFLFLLLSLIRGQMMVLFVVWFLVSYVLMVKNGIAVTHQIAGKRNTFELAENITKQGLLAVLAAVIIVFTARSAIIHVYNYCEQGLFVDTASGKAMSFANVLYVADREDGEAIEDTELRVLFYEIYDSADADKMNYKYAPSGILGRAAYHEKCHDELNFTYFAEPAKQYVGRTQGIYTDRYQELMIAVDEVAAKLSAELMPQVTDRYVLNYLCVIALGFIRTVAYETTFLAWYAALVYAAAVVLTIWLWRRRPGSMAASFMAVVLLTIVGNVCATALMIQCISRYMIYNLPLFYMAGILELRELYEIYILQKRRR